METNFHHNVVALANSELSKEQIIAELKKLEINEDKVVFFCKAVYKLRHKKNQKTGIVLLIIGGIAMFGGFLLTVFLFHQNQSIHLAMYSFTTIGLLFIFAGIIKFLGW